MKGPLMKYFFAFICSLNGRKTINDPAQTNYNRHSVQVSGHNETASLLGSRTSPRALRTYRIQHAVVHRVLDYKTLVPPYDKILLYSSSVKRKKMGVYVIAINKLTSLICGNKMPTRCNR